MIRSLTRWIAGQGRRGRHGRPASARDQRTRRNAHFTLESLDDRIVLSAAAAAEAAVNAKAVLLEQKHEVRLARLEARHAARLGKANGAATPIVINASTSTTTPVSVSPVAVDAALATTFSVGHPSPSHTRLPVSTTSPISVPELIPPSTTHASSPGPLPANVAAALQGLYEEYESQGGGSSFTPDEPNDKLLVISGTSVGVQIKASASADFNTLVSRLQSEGMQVSSSSATYGLIDGMLPIAELGTVARLSGTTSVTPMSPPMVRSRGHPPLGAGASGAKTSSGRSGRGARPSLARHAAASAGLPQASYSATIRPAASARRTRLRGGIRASRAFIPR